MENYSKPSMKYIELRVEESLAGSGSLLFNQDMSLVANNQDISNNWVKFWLKLMRV